MVEIRAGYSREVKKKIKKLASRIKKMEKFDKGFSKENLEYMKYTIDTRFFVDSLGREFSEMLIPELGREVIGSSSFKEMDYSYISKSRGYDLVSRIDIRTKDLDSLSKKLRIKEKTYPDYVLKDIGRMRIIVKDEKTAYQLLDSIKKGAIKDFMKKSGYVLEDIDDYIKKPKSDGYKALHLTIANGYGSDEVCEVKIMPKKIYDKVDKLHEAYKAKQEEILAM